MLSGFMNRADIMIEVIRPRSITQPRAALFDFDGTLSLIRSGWQQIMATMMVEILLQLPEFEAPAVIQQRVVRAIDQLTGQATIEQMSWLCKEIERRGGQPDSAESHKFRFLEQLNPHIDRRYNALRNDQLSTGSLLVPGARGLLEKLRDRGVRLILVSGTDLAAVVADARALGVAEYFGAQIYAPSPHNPNFSKRAVIARLLSEEQLSGAQLVAFGDGPVEIAETRAVGGVAVGVAFDEETRAGLDQHKRAMLIRAGADVIVADFSEQARLLNYLGGASADTAD
jgi:phosphoglycolate phosphatase